LPRRGRRLHGLNGDPLQVAREPPERAFRGEQVVELPALHNPPVLEHDDLVGAANGG